MRVQETLVVPLATGGSWDSSNGHDGEPMINRGSRKSIAVSQHLQLGVAKTIHLSGKAATPALGRDLPVAPGAPVTAVSMLLPLTAICKGSG